MLRRSTPVSREAGVAHLDCSEWDTVRQLSSGDQKRGRRIRGDRLPLLGSNQDSPDPEGPLKNPTFQQLATFYASRVTRCWSLLGFMPDFAVLYSLKCQSLLSPFRDFQSARFPQPRP